MPDAARRTAGLLSLVVVATSAAGQDLPADRPATVKVAAIQSSSTLGAVAENTEKLTRLVRQAAANGARIAVLPETAVTGYLSQDLKRNWHVPGRPLAEGFRGVNPAECAEIVPGKSTRHFAALAAELKIYLTIPLLEVVPGSSEQEPPRYFNTVCLAAPSGELVAHYRKLTPWPHPEQSWATEGDLGVQTVPTEYGPVGLAICYDIHTILDRWDRGELWALLYPIAWVDDGHPAEWFWHTLPEKIDRYDVHLIGANWSVDRRPDWFGYGFSTVIGPDGEVLASATSLYGSEIIYATLPCR